MCGKYGCCWANTAVYGTNTVVFVANAGVFEYFVTKNTAYLWQIYLHFCIVRTNTAISRTHTVLFLTNTVILETNPVILKTNPVIFRINPVIF